MNEINNSQETSHTPAFAKASVGKPSSQKLGHPSQEGTNHDQSPLEGGGNPQDGRSVSTIAESKLLPLPEKQMPGIEELLKSGVHFGHQAGRWDPRAGSYIYGERNGVHIINLQKTTRRLEEALKKVNEIVSRQGRILFVGTKRQVRSLVLEAAKITGMPYVTERWLGGTFTNFPTISRRIQKLLDIEVKFKEGKLSRYTKKEQMKFRKHIQDFEKNMGGIKTLNELPQAIFVVGVKEEKTAIAEAKKTGIPVIALADTNINPEELDYPIPANDDAVKSVQLMLKYVAREIQEAKKVK